MARITRRTLIQYGLATVAVSVLANEGKEKLTDIYNRSKIHLQIKVRLFSNDCLENDQYCLQQEQARAYLGPYEEKKNGPKGFLELSIPSFHKRATCSIYHNHSLIGKHLARSEEAYTSVTSENKSDDFIFQVHTIDGLHEKEITVKNYLTSSDILTVIMAAVKKPRLLGEKPKECAEFFTGSDLSRDMQDNLSLPHRVTFKLNDDP